MTSSRMNSRFKILHYEEILNNRLVLTGYKCKKYFVILTKDKFI